MSDSRNNNMNFFITSPRKDNSGARITGSPSSSPRESDKASTHKRTVTPAVHPTAKEVKQEEEEKKREASPSNSKK